MACYHPLQGWHLPGGGWTSNYNVSNQIPMSIPCGQCLGCKTQKKLEWATRLMHENSLHDDTSFITLTYDDAYLPTGGTLIKKDFQDFMKRLRQSFYNKKTKTYSKKLRFYHCGEYGEKHFRPHYHAIIFNHDFPDKVPWKKDLYTSESLSDAWQNKGFVTTGDVTRESCAYVANYTQKKLGGPLSKKKDPMTGLSKYESLILHDLYDDPDLGPARLPLVKGEIIQLQPEYSTMSRRPGIGKDWFKKHKSDCFPSDNLHDHNGKSVAIPKYYTRLYELTDQEILEGIIKPNRQRRFDARKADFTPERLAVKKQIQIARMSTYKKTL